MHLSCAICRERGEVICFIRFSVTAWHSFWRNLINLLSFFEFKWIRFLTHRFQNRFSARYVNSAALSCYTRDVFTFRLISTDSSLIGRITLVKKRLSLDRYAKISVLLYFASFNLIFIFCISLCHVLFTFWKILLHFHPHFTKICSHLSAHA